MTSRSGSGGVAHRQAARCAALACGLADRRGHRARVGAVLPGDVERGAMVGRGADDRQAERDVDAFLEMERLQRDQRLVVIHAQGGVVARARRGVEHGVGGVGAGDVPAFGRAAPRSRG